MQPRSNEDATMEKAMNIQPRSDKNVTKERWKCNQWVIKIRAKSADDATIYKKCRRCNPRVDDMKPLTEK